ncbi:hypothetical protein [Phocicoccus pinnipedialis]|uniref:ATP:guanido phosphotransferase n=1 Tax=Phocicoccus pinnipedialis TaxID=110845 RepID=A0A6V7R3S7_9BACL|nr:hypothetical protein [Jeotgalicoccus pinnipedialis]MBP1940076.1 protein arginine kinase [Jeotgalicoccus pinnipedialis]CAD2071976.1 Putative ATP:guanido phosphotransferase [Jeotgalicoccus pinnipedialis]
MTDTWLDEKTSTPIVMSSRIRLARNIEGLAFPHMLNSTEELEKLADVVSETFIDFKNLDMSEYNILEKALLVEEFLISPRFLKQGVRLILSEDKHTSIMIGEEDHIRIQVVDTDKSLEELYKTASTLDDKLEKSVEYAFDTDYGYQTACPTNVGTGLRASVMLHLPALTKNRRIKRIMDALTRMGYTLRGIYGEGSAPLGEIYQLSNQVTLGVDEYTILENLKDIKNQIVNEEEKTRQWFYHNRALSVRDFVFRSYGLLKYAQKMSLEEAAEHLSNVKYGVDMKILEVDHFHFQRWMCVIQHAFIRKRIEDKNLQYTSLEEAENRERAILLKELLGGNE